MRKICVAILLVPALAWAQPKAAPKTAGEWYKEGENQYILGNFEKAIEAFKQGFSLETDEDKRAKYVFNIAQAYRQGNDCARAQFFYKRFIALKSNPKTTSLDPQLRREVEDRIKDLEECARQAAAISKRPPETLPGEPDGSEKSSPANTEPRKDTHDEAQAPVTSAAGAQGHDEEERSDTGEPRTGARPHVISARVTGGGTKVNAGKLPTPVQATFTVIAGYPIAVNDRLTVDAGVAFTLTPLPWNASGPTPRSGTGLLTSVMANAGIGIEVLPRITARVDLGVGALFFSGISESPFTEEMRPADGALTMFHLRAAASADYAFTPNFIGTITPIAFTFSPAKTGLESSIDNITSIDFMLGIGYRM